ncbi:kinetochore protein Mis13 [Lophiotrema nucula]|uniref:Kinetochore protein Mis13 n=1 Tax=Lophiotrema nucula TaxID=690887 RepID=A0A6A5Z0G7_9PLEO|nr:kinetochore protein Mis13 [Lophiotrema nucula]
MHAVYARSPLQNLPMATNRTMTRRRSVTQAFEDEDAPAAKRAKTEVNGAGKRANGATKKAAKASYDEDDDGFQFARRTSRRTAVKAHPAPESIPEEPPKPASTRRKKNSLAPPEPEHEEPQRKRRSARLSGDKENLEAPPTSEPSKSLPKRTRKGASTEKSVLVEKKKHATPAPEPDAKSSAFLGVQTPQNDKIHISKRRETKIMLPFADTPVITRNKEMRKGNKDGHRRSSTGLRGRRASSLIESGMSNALPHSEVESREFYKYIEQSLPEPRRMKQLLTWCGARALPEKPSGDVENGNAIMAARAIQQELISDFANRPELSDWFSREDTAPTSVVKKANPHNVRNQSTLQELEEEVKRLEEEKAAWEALASAQSLLSVPSITTETPALSEIDTSLLDPSQAAILEALQSQPQAPDPVVDTQPPASSFTFTTPAALQSHLSQLSAALEPNIDIFADGVHKIQQYRNTAERVADRVLGTAAQRLEERDREGKEKVGSGGIGVGDVLRSLSGVLNDVQ